MDQNKRSKNQQNAKKTKGGKFSCGNEKHDYKQEKCTINKPLAPSKPKDDRTPRKAVSEEALAIPAMKYRTPDKRFYNQTPRKAVSQEVVERGHPIPDTRFDNEFHIDFNTLFQKFSGILDWKKLNIIFTNRSFYTTFKLTNTSNKHILYQFTIEKGFMGVRDVGIIKIKESVSFELFYTKQAVFPNVLPMLYIPVEAAPNDDELDTVFKSSTYYYSACFPIVMNNTV